MVAKNYLVRRDDLTIARMADTDDLSPASGEVVLRVDRFALTANNITYGVAGDIIGYWNFFPAADGWGRIPVWGVGTVTASAHPQVETGQQFYGYFPMSTELKVMPERVGPRGFTDASPHRSALPVVYNQYSLMTAENGFDPAHVNHAMLYRPLFTTSFVLDDYFADNAFFGASNVILGSASSKTAFGMAFMLKRRQGIRIVGLTSAANRAFVEQLGLYDAVLTYDEVESLPLTASAYVDMSGNRSVLARVHRHLREHLKASCGVGITHWEARDGEAPGELPGPKPTMFFAPTQIVKRNQELGPDTYQRLLAEATAAFFAAVERWVAIEEHPFAEVEAVYRSVLAGASPDRGFIIVC